MAQQKKVKTIPATRTQYTSVPISEQKKRRVAGYARVSTDSDEQFTSYEAQVDYYTRYIQSRDDWEFVAVYTDEGITGTSTRHREGFKAMVADAIDGKIDLIITKSVSRFARNTVDSLSTIRTLKEHGVECFFEKENIWTFDSKGELLITIMSSLAQEEARSISENCTWGQRKRMADGKVSVAFTNFLGYDRGSDGELIVNEKEAVTVRRIYQMFLEGMTPYGIAKRLTSEGIPSPAGKSRWLPDTVRSILENEKYRGDALLQKTYTADYLTKKKKVNNGEIPQYYVENNHEPIIPPEVHEMVQRELERRGQGRNRHSGVHPFSGKIKCGQCGGWYGSKVWHSTDQYRRIIWQCNHKYCGEKCSTPHFTDEEVQAVFLSAVNRLVSQKEDIIAGFSEIADTVLDTSSLEAEETELEAELGAISGQIQQCIYENAHVAQDQSEYRQKYEALSQRYDSVSAKLDLVRTQTADRVTRRAAIEDFLKELQRLDGPVTEFDPGRFGRLVDYITVYSRDDVRVTFKDGTEIRA